MTTVVRFDFGLKPVIKHLAGQHDQKAHGSWATLAGDDLIADWNKEQKRIPTSPPNPEGTNTQALRSWVDGPFRNFTGNFPIMDVYRHYMHGILGLPLTPYNEIYSDRQRYISSDTLNTQAQNLLESLDKAPPSQPVLWRGVGEGNMEAGMSQGMGFDKLLNLQEGDELVTPMFSASRDKDVANMYSVHGISGFKGSSTKPVIVFRIAEGAKGLRVNVVPDDKEVLTGGKFRVTGRAETTLPITSHYEGNERIMRDQPVVLISLTQEDTFGAEDFVKPNFYENTAYRVGRRR